MAWAHKSRAFPERPHLKQWKTVLSRLAEKQRAVPEEEPCNVTWPPLLIFCYGKWLKAETIQHRRKTDRRPDGGEVNGRGGVGFELIFDLVTSCFLTNLPAPFPGLFEFAIPLRKHLLVFAIPFVLRGVFGDNYFSKLRQLQRCRNSQ